MSTQTCQGLLVEHLVDQALILVHEDVVTVRGGNTRRLLATMLQRVQAKICQA